MKSMKKILIAGATGQIGSSVGQYLTSLGDWNPVGLARSPQLDADFPMIAVDLTQPEDCLLKLGSQTDVTHILYAARFDHYGGELEAKDVNVAMLKNLLNAVAPVASQLRHIHLVHGTKFYGHTVAKRSVPYREDDACGNFNSFYFDQQSLIEQRQSGQNWSWSISRPHAFCNYRTDEPRNLILIVAIYATLLRELGLPLIFPGTTKSYASHTQFSWLPTLARAAVWMMQTAHCANQAYNVVNGDPMSWKALWPVIADYFEMPVGAPDSSSFASFTQGKDALWRTITKKYGLEQTDLHTVAQWPYGDYVLSVQWDVVSDMSKAQRDGFTEQIDSKKMWLEGFDFFRTKKIIP
jgi:nucleoside-diphosphate-sugar epimerase